MGQIIITIGRENGSGGRDIATRIARELGLPLYDVNLLYEVAKEMNMDLDPSELNKYDEAPTNLFTSRHLYGDVTNSVQDILAEKQFEFLKEKAEEGESFIVVGRCGDWVLKDYPCVLKIFIHADHDSKVKRIAMRHDVDEHEAEKIIKKADKNRKQYYAKHTHGAEWGDQFWYDVHMKSNLLGIDGTANVLVKYINEYQEVLYNNKDN